MSILVRLVSLGLLAGLISACASTRQLNVGRPTQTLSPVSPLAGSAGVDGDDYYIQLVSELVFQGLDDSRSNCHEIGSSYAKGGAKSALMLQVRNDALNYSREFPGFVYETSKGRCGFSLDAKKTYLTPWMRLDTGKASQIDYSFLRSDSGQLDVGRIGNDVNTASNVLAVTGVGTGVAVLGKVASGWMMNQGQTGQQTPPPSPGTRHQESRSLPQPVSLVGNAAAIGQIHFPVFAVGDGSLNPFSSKPEALGEVLVSADVKPSLLLRLAASGVPDARDLSLEELLRTQIQNGSGGLSLERLILQAEHADRPNLQPDPNNYRDLESNCRKLKVVLRDLGFNKFDRNAVLYYLLEKSTDWKNYNTTGQSLLGEGVRLSQLQQYRTHNFGGCLIPDDYEVMKRMGLPVNADQDWATTIQQVQEKESYFGAIQSIERQLAALLRNTNAGEVERQIFPLLSSTQGGGTVLLQNNLGNFGLEQALNVPSIPGEGVVATAQQLAQVFALLKVSELSCARAVFEQGRPVKNVAIMLFLTATDSPLAKGGALEFQFDGNKVVRISLQNPSLRDFRQDVLNHPEVGDCRIDPAWLQKI